MHVRGHHHLGVVYVGSRGGAGPVKTQGRGTIVATSRTRVASDIPNIQLVQSVRRATPVPRRTLDDSTAVVLV